MRSLAAAVVALLAVLGAEARADDTRPVSLGVRETAPGRFAVRFQTPMRGTARLRARPRLPEGARTVPGSYRRDVSGDSLIERFEFELEGGLVGREIGVDGLALGSRNALLRVRLHDGRDLRAVLGAGRPALLVEPAAELDRGAWLRDAAEATRRGLLRGVTGLPHLLLAVAVVLAARGRSWIVALLAFPACVMAAAAMRPLLPSAPAPALADGLVALAAGLVAREALRPRARRVAALAAGAGLAHGLALPPAVAGPLAVLGHAAGVDVAHLAAAGAALGIARLLRRPAWATGGAWVAGVLAMAVAAAGATAPDRRPGATETAGLYPIASAETGPGAAARAAGLQTDVEAYLDIGVFDTRLEVLGRFPCLERWLGPLGAAGPMLEVGDQPAVLRRAAEALLGRLAITVDGAAVEPDSVRHAFAVLEPTGSYLREEPVPEPLSDAIVGVIVALPTTSIPDSVRVEWSDLPSGLASMRARVIDPETSREAEVRPDSPRLAWENTLAEDPLPPVEAVRVRRAPVPLPAASIVLAVVALVLAARLRRRAGSSGAGVCLRCGLGAALLCLPVGAVDIGALVGAAPSPTPREARAIAGALLDNVYRALNVREEEAAYDRLALSLAGELRTTAYLESRRALAFSRVGGARTHVDVVELLDLEDLRARPDGGFLARARWTVTGSVTHFGHRHLRQNLYAARLGVTPAGGTWTIDVFDVRDVERRR